MKVVVIIKSIDIHDFLIVNLEAKHLFPRVAVSLFLFYFTLVIEWDEKVFFIILFSFFGVSWERVKWISD